MGTSGTHLSDHAAREIKDAVPAVVEAAKALVLSGADEAQALEEAVTLVRRQRREAQAEAKRVAAQRRAEVAARLEADRAAAQARIREEAAGTSVADLLEDTPGEPVEPGALSFSDVLTPVDTTAAYDVPAPGINLLDLPETDGTIDMPNLRAPTRRPVPEPEPLVPTATEEPGVKPIDWSGLVHMLNVSKGIRDETRGMEHGHMLAVALHALRDPALTRDEREFLFRKAVAVVPDDISGAWARDKAMGR
jgi:hypothetical protein